MMELYCHLLLVNPNFFKAAVNGLKGLADTDTDHRLLLSSDRLIIYSSLNVWQTAENNYRDFREVGRAVKVKGSQP